VQHFPFARKRKQLGNIEVLRFLQMSSTVHGLMGTWHIAYSTLTFWKKGGRRNGRLEYTDLSDTGAASWTDTTVYDQPAWFSSACKQQKIVGTDTVLSTNPLQFQWRGAGLLRFLHSDCKVCCLPYMLRRC
jgi:hypothetical protein